MKKEINAKTMTHNLITWESTKPEIPSLNIVRQKSTLYRAMNKIEVPFCIVFHDLSESLRCSISLMLDICRISPKAIKSDAANKFTIPDSVTPHTKNLEIIGINPTNTV